jgi:3-phenylpropionate/trans-cinnamate dioxygenase ferredoxin reductase subunit
MRSTDRHYDVLIVGAGHGGASTAMALRRLGHAGTIAMVSKELDPPYERPPLSKDYLSGERSFERLLMRPESFWAEQGIDLLLGREAVALDAGEHRLRLADGAALSYGSLVWSAGGEARRLACSGHDVAGVHTIRNRADVDRLRTELICGEDIVVIGGGYIGLEAAAILTKAGKRVTVLEAADRLLARVSSAPLSRFFEAEHRRRGVDVRLNVTVDCIEARDGAAVGVRLADGTILPANIVIVGIGIDPCIAPLRAAGAAVGAAGVIVDAFCRTSLEDVYAVGDCVEFANPFAGGASLRLESVQNATDQGSVAAKAIIAVPEPYAAIPWFWSEQYDFRLQTVGIALGHDQIVVRGDADAPGFSLLYLKDGKVIALDCLSNVKDYVQGRMLINSGKIVSPDRLADCALPLKTLAA